MCIIYIYNFHYFFHYNNFLMCESPLYAVNKESVFVLAGHNRGIYNRGIWGKLDRMLGERRRSTGETM